MIFIFVHSVLLYSFHRKVYFGIKLCYSRSPISFPSLLWYSVIRFVYLQASELCIKMSISLFWCHKRSDFGQTCVSQSSIISLKGYKLQSGLTIYVHLASYS